MKALYFKSNKFSKSWKPCDTKITKSISDNTTPTKRQVDQITSLTNSATKIIEPKHTTKHSKGNLTKVRQFNLKSSCLHVKRRHKVLQGLTLNAYTQTLTSSAQNNICEYVLTCKNSIHNIQKNLLLEFFLALTIFLLFTNNIISIVRNSCNIYI